MQGHAQQSERGSVGKQGTSVGTRLLATGFEITVTFRKRTEIRAPGLAVTCQADGGCGFCMPPFVALFLPDR
jgi:hypothetical protein